MLSTKNLCTNSKSPGVGMTDMANTALGTHFKR